MFRRPTAAGTLSGVSVTQPLVARPASTDFHLRPLRSTAWYYVQNPEFARLRLTVHPSARVTVAKYLERYGELGHDHDLRLWVGESELLVRRPVCQQAGPCSLSFEFMLTALSLERPAD
jgi:hypothetical protein